MYVARKTIPYRTSRYGRNLPFRQVKRYRNTTDSYHPKYGYFGSFRHFWCVSTVNLFRAGTRWMRFFFFFLSIFGTYISLSLECWMTMIVQISACWIIPHFFFLLSSFNWPDGSGGLSFLFLFSFQRATPYFLYILER